MGSQTLEIIRQGVWASLTGGWFYDPHQNVFCNAIHLYLWLFLLCAPFVTYLYFPTTFTTWGVYCITTTFTITMLKIINMALHVLYDKAQAISDPNLKVTIKGSKENEGDDDCGIEMQVLGNDNLPSRTSVEQPINEVSEANSMLSINEHVTSTIDLKVDVHRKNSSESSGSISIYPTGVIKNITSVPIYRAETHYQQQSNGQQFNAQKHDNNNQQQQQCQNENDNIRRRYSDNIHQLDKSLKQEIPSQYSVPIFKDAIQQQQNNPLNQQQQYRKHHHHRNYSQGHEMYSEIWRTKAPLCQQESTIITQNQQQQQIYQNICNNSNNSNEQQQQQPNKKDEKTKRKCKTRLERQNSLDTATQIRNSSICSGNSNFGYNNKQYQIENTLMRQRSAHICGRSTFTNNNNYGGNHEFNNSNNCVDNLHTKAIKRLNKTSKLQRHRSTESHDDYQRAHNRNMLFFGGRQDNIIGHHLPHQQQMSTDIISHHHRTTSSNLGLSDMYLANNNYTKSDLVMEQLEHNLNLMHSLLPQTKPMRKDSNSTMSALQLPLHTSNTTIEQQKTRRHSNTSCKPLQICDNTNNINILTGNCQQTNVRRIKSTALEISCQQPSVSNLSPHPNSVEAIIGQQIKNPQSALLPPPSKCLVRNPHLNLCSKFGSINSQTNDLIKSSGIMEPVYPEETETDEKCSISDGGGGDCGSGIIFTIKKTNSNNCDSDDNENCVNNDNNDDHHGNDNKADIDNENSNNNIDDDDDDDGNDDIDNRDDDDYDNIEKEHCNDIKRCSMTESESEIERPRTQSTDSETDNNGSRSPLLNKNRCENNKSNININRIDEIKIQQQKHQSFSSNNLIKNGNFLNKKLGNNNNNNNSNNNGCPSSDCEHMSASSKDMLLEEDYNNKMDSSNNVNIENNINQSNCNNQEKPIENYEIEIDDISVAAIPRGLDIAQEEADIENLRVKDAKSLGAIPKTVMRRSSELTSCLTTDKSVWSQKPKSMSRTSSSASSRSFSAESFSNDIYKTYKDHYLFGGIGGSHNNNNNGQNGTSAVNGIIGNINQTNNTSSLGLPAVGGCTSFVAYPRRTLVDSNYRLHHKLRGSSRHNHYGNECERVRRMEEISANYDSDDLQKNCLENTITTNSITTNPTITTTTTALSIQGLMNEQYSFENSIASGDQQRRQSITIGGVSGGGVGGIGGSISNNGIGVNGNIVSGNNSGAANILNVGESIYCDFPWHPCSMSTDKPIQPKRFYKYHIKCFGKHDIKIAMDRLQLLALFDRDLNWFHVILAIILSGTVCFLGAIILQMGFYKDIFAFIFCIVIAGSLYSLLKSVQPDAASPIHGFNKTVAYSRPIYFCLCSGLLIFSNHLSNEFSITNNSNNNNTDNNIMRIKNLQFFGIIFSATEFFRYITEFMSIILLLFPIFFSLGLFPQINTFCMYILEQIDMHIFGGNATCSLISSILCIIKSILAICILYGPVYGGLIEQKGTQHFLFSFFCSLLIPIGYHLSRSASDFSHIWAIIKSSLVNTYSDDDDDDEIKHLNNNNNNNNEQLQQQQLDDEKSTNVQHGSSTKEITNPSSLDDLRPKDDIIDDDLNSQQSKTIYSTESKLDIIDNNAAGGDGGAGNGDCCNNNNNKDDDNNNKTDEIINTTIIGDGIDNGENESTTATLSSAQPADNLVSSTNNEQPDPLPKKLQNTVNCRLKNDLVVSTVLSVFILSLHCSTVFTVLQPDLNIVLYSIACIMGILLHYIIPQMRKHMPWLCFARPLLKQKEFGQFEVADAAKIMWFEGAYVYLCFLERNVLYPLIFISAITADSQNIVQKFGIHFGAAIISICALKCVRNAYSDPANQYLILVFSVLLFKIDFNFASETFLINYFFISILFKKSCDFLLKLQFIVTYIAPWQITWGSAFHAFAQPFSVPHSAMLFLQAAISAILSTPLNPFLGSAIFLTSYVRPIKFWERDYNTRRIDHSNTRLSSQLERDLGADDNNLNSIFYEHLTRSLQHSLCGDLLLGRWGNVNQGDCFVLASDYLNCLVHIIELGNGLCTFQMRGLEFRGTYCQQREVEAISEGVEDNDACCCCNPGHIPRMLSANAMFSTRWLAWQVVAAQYVLEGYSISENLATATLQVFEFRKVLITYYIKSIIYYVTRNPKLEKWLSSGPIQDALASTLDRQFVDLDIIFNYNLDEDFDFRVLGITRSSFCSIYLNWIQFCYKKRKDSMSATTPDKNPSTTATKQDPKNNSSQKLEQQQQQTPTTTTNDINNQNYSANNNSNNTTSNNTNNNQNSKYNNQSQSTSLNPIPFANTPLGNPPTDNNNECVGDYLENIPTTSTSHLRRNKKKHYKRKLKFGETATDSSDRTAAANQAPLNSTTTTNNNNNIIGNSPITKDSPLVSLCLALGLLARRSLATASHSSLSGVEFFLHGLHALFKGDFRITSPRDEWVFADMELLHGVVAPAVKMALKLHQDHFSSPDEYLDPSVLYEAITTHSKDLVISHEADPIWRSAVLRGAPNLLALRHVMEDGSDEYRIIRLTKRFLSFRVIKLNRECVRGLWAGQQQELIYLRNRNPERGSIQNAKQALRNIINSSCDQPIGYPIYVSPLTTSYADTNDQLCQIIGGSITLESIKQMVMDTWRRVRIRCRQGCSSGSGGIDCDIGGTSDAPMVYFSPITGTNTAGTLSYGSQSLSGTGTRGSLASMNKPNSSTLLAGFLNRERDQERDFIREGRTNRKTQSNWRNDRDRRATLPIASSAMNSSDGSGSRDLMIKDSMESTSNDLQKFVYSVGYDTGSGGNNCTPSDNTNLCDANTTSLVIDGNSAPPTSGTENYVPDYSNNTINENCKSPNQGENSGASGIDDNEQQKTTNFNRSSLFELNRKVIIVDGLEIYDCLDLGRRIDVVWPNEKMRANGGRSSWEDWIPREGMVGYIRHFWQPNHPDKRFRSNVNRTVYLIEIGERFVPVSEKGIREYNQILNEPNTTTPINGTNNTNNLPLNTTNISTSANIPITSNLKRSSIYLSNNNNTGASSNLHKTLRDHSNYSTSAAQYNEPKNIPFTNITTDLDDELLTTCASTSNTTTTTNPITKIENLNNPNITNHLNKNKKNIFTDIQDVEATVAEIFENLSNNSTESEDTNGTDFSCSQTISENSNSNSTDDNILKD